MPRLSVLLLAVLFALAAPAAVAAQASADAVVADLDAFWAQTFAAAGRDYASPAVVALDAPTETACGTIDPAWGPGAYCGLDQTIYYSPAWLGDLSAAGHDFAWITVMAHEWGHHVQLQLGLLGYPDAATELQADCLAGAYAADAEARGLLTPGAVAEAISLSALSGDLGWLPRDAPAHGSGAERAISFSRGYQEGVAGCGIGL